LIKTQEIQAMPRPPRRVNPVTINDANGKVLATIDIGYDWREFDRYLQRLHALLGLFPDGDKGINLFTGHLDNQTAISELGRSVWSRVPGMDGQDGEDGFTFPPIKGERGAEGRMGSPGMDGESGSEDFPMTPPGISKDVLKAYFDTLYLPIRGNYCFAVSLSDGGIVTLPTIMANYPAHGFIQCAHASTGVISESAEFEYGSTGEVQIIRGTANIEAGGATAGKISLGPVADANPVVIKNNLGGGVSVNVLITVWYN